MQRESLLTRPSSGLSCVSPSPLGGSDNIYKPCLSLSNWIYGFEPWEHWMLLKLPGSGLLFFENGEWGGKLEHVLVAGEEAGPGV